VVRRSFGQILVDSSVAAIAIVVLLLRSLEPGLLGLGPLLVRVAYFLVNVVAIRGTPWGSITLGVWLGLLLQHLHIVDAAAARSSPVTRFAPDANPREGC
jgi:hypothetical protein